MKTRTQFECMNKECNTILIDRNKDGVRCPRCKGPVNPKPFIPFEEDKDITLTTYKCLCCGYSSKEKVCPICSGAFADTWYIQKHLPKEENKLLVIELDDINAVPKIYYKGEEVTHKMRVSFDWMTKGGKERYPTYIRIEQHDEDSKSLDIKVIQHNHPVEK